MKIDNNSAIYNVADINKTASLKQEAMEVAVGQASRAATKSVDLNLHDQTLISENSAVLSGMPAIDAMRVSEIKAQIQSGQLTFDMGALAKVLSNLS